jgi:hypothetical protein
MSGVREDQNSAENPVMPSERDRAHELICDLEDALIADTRHEQDWMRATVRVREALAAEYAAGFADARERIAMRLALLHVKAIDDAGKGSEEDAVAVILYDELRKWLRALTPERERP